MDSDGPAEPPERREPTPDPADPVRSAFVMAVQIMEAGRASLLLRQGKEPVLTIVAAVGIKPSLVESIRVENGRGIAGVVAERGMSLLGRSPTNETFVSAPIITSQGIEGVLNLTERFGGKQYHGADLTAAGFVTRHIATLLEYRRDALVDPVSGLPNRRAFEATLERELARAARAGRHFSVVFLDVDGLKQINDTLGHAAGDALLQNVGRALQHAIRQYDFAARIGGDEFALLLADTPEGETSLIRRIAARAGAAGARWSLSIGIAHYPGDGRTASELLAAADQRMYEYKRAHAPGRSRPEPGVEGR